ncbi:MAG: DeoR/GlpR family DNA-binding transcription regulator [Bacillota bacterium]|nr:DeoR/GlpR family DNA-binding transcription regulator [Bacillota bacterium]
MLTLERHNKILEILNKKKSVTVNELSKKLFASPATIRRDLTAMEKSGLITRSHGGAVLYESSNAEPSQVIREHENIKEKKVIANLAADFIKNSYSIFLDSSSTAGFLVPHLTRFRNLSVVTTGIKNALLLMEKTDVRVHVPGGMIAPNSNTITGSDTLEYISHINVDVAFISCAGIDTISGITEGSFEQSQLKRKMLSNAKSRILLCDSSKFGHTFLCRTCDFNGIDYFISDKTPDAELANAITTAGCEIIAEDNL